jgi:DNA-binding XRE family transcriptional regulator
MQRINRLSKPSKLLKKSNSTSPYAARNKAVSENRGEEWRKSLIQGKLDSQLNPSKLKLLRVKMNVPQKYIADKVKMTLSYYGMIERGTRKVTKEQAEKICDLLGKKLSDLFMKSDSKFIVVK